MLLSLVLLAQVATATPAPAPVPTRDPRPIPVRRAEEFPGTYVLFYREWKTYGSIMLQINYRPELGLPGGFLRVHGTVDSDKGWRWLKDHPLQCIADGARLPFEETYDSDIGDGYLSESVRADVSRDEIRVLAKAERVECFVGSTQIDTWPARRANLLKDLDK